jgi:hypothetical protein
MGVFQQAHNQGREGRERAEELLLLLLLLLRSIIHYTSVWLPLPSPPSTPPPPSPHDTQNNNKIQNHHQSKTKESDGYGGGYRPKGDACLQRGTRREKREKKTPKK